MHTAISTHQVSGVAGAYIDDFTEPAAPPQPPRRTTTVHFPPGHAAAGDHTSTGNAIADAARDAKAAASDPKVKVWVMIDDGTIVGLRYRRTE